MNEFNRELFRTAERLAAFNDSRTRNALQVYLLAHGLLAEHSRHHSVLKRQQWTQWAIEAEAKIRAFLTSVESVPFRLMTDSVL